MKAREKESAVTVESFPEQSSFPMFQSRGWLQHGPGKGEVFYGFFMFFLGQHEPSGQ